MPCCGRDAKVAMYLKHNAIAIHEGESGAARNS